MQNSRMDLRNSAERIPKRYGINSSIPQSTPHIPQQDSNADIDSTIAIDTTTTDTDQNGTKKRRRSSFLKKKKAERPKLPRLKLSEYSFPKTILTPPESWGEIQYDSDDRKLHDHLETEYLNEIAKLHFFPNDILIRFTLSQRGLTPFDARRKETEKHFKIYLKFHYQHRHDDILTNHALNAQKSLSSLKEDVNTFGVFIYGQDRYGHPIFWDDGKCLHITHCIQIPAYSQHMFIGSIYTKDANLDIFKNNSDYVGKLRSRLFKRMHNMKLAASQQYGKMIYKHCMVMDLGAFNSKQFLKMRKLHEQNAKDTADLFPEVLHKLYIINAPKAFRIAWKIIQTFLHPVTVEKTKILGGDYIDVLCKDIDLDMIPERYGGIGPWDIVYGAEPFEYALSSKDIKFNYDILPKPTEPAPPRAAVPDMNKHKAKKDKQMKMSGLETYEDEKENDSSHVKLDGVAKSAPVGHSEQQVEDEKNGK